MENSKSYSHFCFLYHNQLVVPN